MRRLAAIIVLSLGGSPVLAFDQGHSQWTALLMQYVEVADDGHSSTVRYANLKKDEARLDAYLRTLSAVSNSEYTEWSKPEQLAFLINAYNALTIKLVLRKYPDLESIRDLGIGLQSPWERKFFRLLGKQMSLDDIEHGMIRARGVFDEPRIHFALVCASIGCPMLRNEAYTGHDLNRQLDDAFCRFLSNPKRNYFDPVDDVLHVSSLFLWYAEDFESGFQGFISLHGTFASYARCLTQIKTQQTVIQRGAYRISYLQYDWGLNDAGRWNISP